MLFIVPSKNTDHFNTGDLHRKSTYSKCHVWDGNWSAIQQHQISTRWAKSL